MTKPMIARAMGLAAVLAGGALTASAQEVRFGIICQYPDVCHEEACLDDKTPLLVLFFTGETEADKGIVFSTPGGDLPGLSLDVQNEETWFLRVGRVEGQMPLRSMSYNLESGNGLLSLWMEDGAGSYTVGGACRLAPGDAFALTGN